MFQNVDKAMYNFIVFCKNKNKTDVNRDSHIAFSPISQSSFLRKYVA